MLFDSEVSSHKVRKSAKWKNYGQYGVISCNLRQKKTFHLIEFMYENPQDEHSSMVALHACREAQRDHVQTNLNTK